MKLLLFLLATEYEMPFPMSWITVIWFVTTGVCLTLAGVHSLVWVRSQNSWGNLRFAIALPTERARLA